MTACRLKAAADTATQAVMNRPATSLLIAMRDWEPAGFRKLRR